MNNIELKSNPSFPTGGSPFSRSAGGEGVNSSHASEAFSCRVRLENSSGRGDPASHPCDLLLPHLGAAS